MQKVIAVVGPTAVGKTALGIEIARALGGEVISGDSRQVYRGLDIGTGKATLNEMKGVPHHLHDVADPRETFTAVDYVRLGRTSISEVSARGHIPIIVGGSGFYIDTLLGRMTPANVKPDHGFRLQVAGWQLEDLQKELRRLDPKRYDQIDTKNPRRLIRAIEIARVRPVTYHLPPAVSYDVLWLGLTLPLPELKEKIHMRLFARIRDGMLDEAKRLHAGGLSYERMEDLGLEYRYMARHLKGDMSYESMISELEKEIVKYAKRQMTWFRKNKEVRWFTPADFDACVEYVKKEYGARAAVHRPGALRA
jgi:tRNA dimethylallyltransferase